MILRLGIDRAVARHLAPRYIYEGGTERSEDRESRTVPYIMMIVFIPPSLGLLFSRSGIKQKKLGCSKVNIRTKKTL